MAKEITVTANSLSKRKKRYAKTKVVISIILMALLFVFIILSVVYKGGRFTVTLDKRLAMDNHIVIYEDNDLKEDKKKLVARDLDFMDNISINWIPSNIDNEANGSHNGENYIAYTFYIENKGDDIVDYWYSVLIDDVIKNVDDAVRVMLFHNGNRTVYGKINAYTGMEEENTKAFFDKDIAVLEQRMEFRPGDVDKFTVVIWLEGDDPDCNDNLLGGEIKMHMEIREEYRDSNEGE